MAHFAQVMNAYKTQNAHGCKDDASVERAGFGVDISGFARGSCRCASCAQSKTTSPALMCVQNLLHVIVEEIDIRINEL